MASNSSIQTSIVEDLPSFTQFYTSSLDVQDKKKSRSYLEKLEEAKNVGSESWPKGSKYRIIKAIAVGGMGAILQAWDTRALRHVAMKAMLRADTDSPAARRFIREARIVANLEHPNIVPVHDIGKSPLEEPYFTMKWVQGENLADILYKLSKGNADYLTTYTLESLLDILIKVCNGMAFAHSKAIVHLDLKPHNILVGDFGEVLVLDWGLAATLNRTPAPSLDLQNEGGADTQKSAGQVFNYEFSLFTKDGTVKGTPGFMAPEQARGLINEISERSDVFSLGSILYMILTLKFPIVGENPSEILNHTINGNFLPPSKRIHPQSVPRQLEGIVMKAMAINQKDRYGSVKDFQADLIAYSRGFPTSVEHAGYARHFFLFVRRRKSEAILMGSSLFVILLLITIFTTRIHFHFKEAQKEKKINKSILKEIGEAKSEAHENKVLAERQKHEANKARFLADFNDYVANLRLAELSIQENRFDIAINALVSCPPRFRNWEWGRLKHLTKLDLLTIRHEDALQTSAFGGNGNIIVFSDHQQQIYIRDIRSGNSTSVSRSENSRMTCIAVNKAGTKFLAGGYDRTVELWNLASNKMIRLYLGHEHPVSALGFSGDGTRIASASWNGTIMIWDAIHGGKLGVIKGNGDRIRSLSLSMDGSILVCGGDDKTITVWDTDSGQKKVALEGHSGEIIALDYHGTQNLIASCSKDGVLRIWNLNTRAVLHEIFSKTSGFNAVSISNKGDFFVADGENFTVTIWETQTGFVRNYLRGHSGPIFSLAISDDDQRVISASKDRTIKMWSVHKGQEPRPLMSHAVPSTALALSPDDKLLACGNQNQSIEFLSFPDGVTTRSFSGFQAASNGLEFSLEGEELVSVTTENTVNIRKVKASRNRLSLTGHQDRVSAIDVSQHGRKIITGSYDNTARIWDAINGRLLHILAAHNEPITRVQISEDGAIAITSGEDQKIIVWNAESGNLMNEFHYQEHQVSALALSKDGSLVVVGYSTGAIKVLSVRTGVFSQQLSGHWGKITSILITKDNSRIISGSEDTTVKIWDTRTGAELTTLKAHTGKINAAAITSDDRNIITAGADGKIFLWTALDWIQ